MPGDVSVRATDLSRPTDLLGAVKLAGQTGRLRYGTLFASEDDSQVEGTLQDGTPIILNATGRDFTVGRLLYEDTTGGGRRAIGWMGTNYDHPDIEATVNAIDMHYFSADRQWVVDTQLMHSDVNGVTGQGFLGDVRYIPAQGVQHSVSVTWIDEALDMNELGFLSRNDQLNLNYIFNLTESDIPGLTSRTTSFRSINQGNIDGRQVINGQFISRQWNFLNNDFANLQFDFYPRRVDDRLGRGSGDFRIPERWGIRGGYVTDPAKPISIGVQFEAGQDDLATRNLINSVGISWRPSDRFNIDLELEYTDQESLLVHRGGGAYTSFESHQWAPRLDSNYFISAKQQFRLTLQWNALKAYEDRFFQVNPARLDYLQEVTNPDNDPDDFVISRLTFQARYRWEIAPLSDLFIVYTRGANLPNNSFLTFQDLLEQSWNDRIVDSVAVKLRYRF